MKRTIVIIIALSIALAGCSRPQYLGSHYYPTYGVLNESTSRSKNVCYEISVGNIVWSLILMETVIVPVYFLGFSLYDPVRLKRGPDDDCSFDGVG